MYTRYVLNENERAKSKKMRTLTTFQVSPEVFHVEIEREIKKVSI